MESIQLGGNIELVGFKELEPGELVVVKKVVGNYAKQMSEASKDFEKLTVTLEKEGEQFKLRAVLKAGKEITAEETDSNLFFAMDKSLKKILSDLG